MPKSLSQLNAQIEKLQREAEALKAREVNDVIARIKEAIQHYELTASDLGLSRSRRAKPETAVKSAARKARKTSTRKSTGVIKFRGPEGQTWTGHGRAPNWFKTALEAGATRQSLEVK